ncbi:MAG: cytosine deaminase [Candidatus Dormibacteraeota bacterium]|nr:cytosine deaminase [Candidatus Dormibacteraeota bacterium]
MFDLLIKDARLPRSEALSSIGIEGGRIAGLAGPGQYPEAREVIEAHGGLLTPALVEPHIHLDAVLTVGQPRQNQSGSLFEGIAIWGERVKELTVEDVKHRVSEVLRWQLANGVLFVRSHVDVCDPNLTALRALLELREEVKDRITIQLVAFPQQGIQSFPNGEGLMRQAVEMGADVVGGIPHFELTREYGVESVKFAMALAKEHGKLVDIHCDETDDDHSRFVEVMAAETIRLDMAGRVTASHTTAMHSYNNAYAGRLIVNIKRAGMHMVTNPLDNATLQGRFDSYPIRRGHTRFKELLNAGVNVCIGHDSVMDPWYPLGYGDPLQAAMVLAHYGQMSGYEEIRTLIDMITINGARALGLRDYGLAVGCRADLVLFDAVSEMDAIRRIAPRRMVFKDGKVVARGEPATHVVNWNGHDQMVDFQPPRAR